MALSSYEQNKGKVRKLWEESKNISNNIDIFTDTYNKETNKNITYIKYEDEGYRNSLIVKSEFIVPDYFSEEYFPISGDFWRYNFSYEWSFSFQNFPIEWFYYISPIILVDKHFELNKSKYFYWVDYEGSQLWTDYVYYDYQEYFLKYKHIDSITDNMTLTYSWIYEVLTSLRMDQVKSQLMIGMINPTRFS